MKKLNLMLLSIFLIFSTTLVAKSWTNNVTNNLDASITYGTKKPKPINAHGTVNLHWRTPAGAKQYIKDTYTHVLIGTIHDTGHKNNDRWLILTTTSGNHRFGKCYGIGGGNNIGFSVVAQKSGSIDLTDCDHSGGKGTDCVPELISNCLDSSFIATLVDGYIINASVSDSSGNIAIEISHGHYIFESEPVGELKAKGGNFTGSNLSNLMTLKANVIKLNTSSDMDINISPITTLLVDYPNLKSELSSSMNRTSKQLEDDFIANNDLNLSKLSQIIYIIYVNNLQDELNTSLHTTTPVNLDAIFTVADKIVDDSSSPLRADTALFLYKVQNYNGTAKNLENDISKYKSAAQGTGASAINYWAKTYGGNHSDISKSIIQTSNGGLAVAGWTTSFGAGGYDFWVLKLDNNGTIIWQKAYGGAGADRAYSISQTDDGQLAVAGETNSFGAGDYDIWVLKLDSNGNIIWQKAYGGSNNDRATSITQTRNGGLAVAGETQSFGAGKNDFWVLKLDNSNGNVIWQKAYGGNGWDEAKSIVQTNYGALAITGLTNSFGAGNWDIWVLKLDSNGNVIWQKAYGGSNLDRVRSATRTNDDGLVVAGDTNSFGAENYDFWVLKLDYNGNIMWQKAYGGSKSEYATSITQTSDGEYAVVGNTASFGAENYNIWVLKLDSDGFVLFRPSSPAKMITTTATATDTSADIATTSATVITTTATVTPTTADATDTTATVSSQAP